MAAPQSSLDRAIEHHRKGELPQAEHIYRQLLAANPNHPDAMHLLGLLAHQAGHTVEGVRLMERSITLNPNSTSFYANLGPAYMVLGNDAAALECYQKALTIDPRYAPAYDNLGLLLQKQNRLPESIAAFLKAIEIDPSNPQTLSNLGITQSLNGDPHEAMRTFERALQLDPNNPAALTNLGLVLHNLHRGEEAVAAFKRAIEIRYHTPEAHLNLASASLELGQVEQALRYFRSSISINPADSRPGSGLLLASHYVPTDRDALLQEHIEWAKRMARPAIAAIRFDRDRDPNRRLRIGYYSPDFKRHSVAFFFEPLMAAHDRSAVELFCYSDTMRMDDVTHRVRKMADHWRDTVPIGDAAFLKQVRDDRIDILVDLAGHTNVHRLQVFALRGAPVQMTYLGYPDTTGLATIDYRLTDAIADPAGSERYYTEQLIRLPRCAWCYAPLPNSPEVNVLPALQAGAVTFGSCNSIAKISPMTADLWAGALKSTAGSRLLLKTAGLANESVRQGLIKQFADRGIDAERLTFRGFDTKHDDHLHVYHDIDIALDTFPYHGTTTTCDALWMGLPVVTLAGEAHVSRVGVSLLDAVGLEANIAATPEQFAAIAAALTADLPALAAMRSSMRERMSKSPLMDRPSIARAIEAAYRQAWMKYIQSE